MLKFDILCLKFSRTLHFKYSSEGLWRDIIAYYKCTLYIVYCIDYIEILKDSGVRDYIGAFAVTAGFGSEELCRFLYLNTNTWKDLFNFVKFIYAGFSMK